MGMTRRAFLSTLTAQAGSLLCGTVARAAYAENARADVTLRIARTTVEIARGHNIKTVTYNGSAPAPILRLRENVPVIVDIFNDTETPEYVHWHGLEVPADIDGAEEENSLVAPAHGHLRYRMTPNAGGARYVHSHAMAGNDLTRGLYSGQFGFLYVESKSDRGRYDQEVFLATHEWEPFFVEADEDETPESVETFGETDWGPTMVEVGYGIRSINGRALGHGEPIRVKEGERVLFHLLNASATENIELFLPAHEFIVIALDGNPVPRPRRVGVLQLGAAERVDAIVEMKSPGVWILGSTDPDIRGSGLGILIEYAGRRGVAGRAEVPDRSWDYTLFGVNQKPLELDKRIRVAIERTPPDANGIEGWRINGKSYTGAGDCTVLQAGGRYRLIFDNRTGDAHPLHLHRNTFEVVRVNGKRTAGVRKDVVVVNAYQTVEVDFTPTGNGLTLFHCHQQLHMDHGLKTLFRVVS
jgi:FtsP/CotA-like multicopper oxidase with cupredoxin domain